MKLQMHSRFWRPYELPCVSKVSSSSNRHAAFWNIRHAVVCPVFKKNDHSTLRHATTGATWTYIWNKWRYLKSIKWPSVSKLLQCHHCVRYKQPRPRSAGSFVTKTFETHHTQRYAFCFKICILSAASPIYIHVFHFPMKLRELRHEDFWNTRHTTPRRLFQKSSWRSFQRFVEKWTVWTWRNGLYGRRLTTQRSDAHFETDGVALRSICLKSLYDDAPCASWRNGLYRCILTTQCSDAHFETDGAALRAVCFKSLRDDAPNASWRNGLYGREEMDCMDIYW